jgi:chromatin segregation and condensation protein Rec8/ScpA/Scc1 (kleisin family)
MQREDAGTATITVDTPGFHGSLEELVARANRGDVDLNELSVSAVVAEARTALESPERSGDLRAVADALSLLARLVALKAAAVLPDQGVEIVDVEDDESTDAGRRLADGLLQRGVAGHARPCWTTWRLHCTGSRLGRSRSLISTRR